MEKLNGHRLTIICGFLVATFSASDLVNAAVAEREVQDFETVSEASEKDKKISTSSEVSSHERGTENVAPAVGDIASNPELMSEGDRSVKVDDGDLNESEASQIIQILSQNSEALQTLANREGKSEQPKTELATYQVFLMGSGFVGFLIALYNIYLTYKHRKDDHESSIIDNFWLREIIIPKTIEPIEEALLKNRYRVDDTSNLSESEIDELVKLLDDLKYKISFANIISEELMIKLEESLDDLVVTIVRRQYPGEVFNVSDDFSSWDSTGDPFFNCYKSMLNHLIATHKSLKMKEFFSV